MYILQWVIFTASSGCRCLTLSTSKHARLVAYLSCFANRGCCCCSSLVFSNVWLCSLQMYLIVTCSPERFHILEYFPGVIWKWALQNLDSLLCYLEWNWLITTYSYNLLLCKDKLLGIGKSTKVSKFESDSAIYVLWKGRKKILKVKQKLSFLVYEWPQKYLCISMGMT